MKNPLLLVSAVVVALAFVSCATSSTPEQRIASRSAAYEKLSQKHKDLVSRGEISEGMSKEAVSLAWGSPDGTVEGLRNGKEMERWDYQGTRSVVTNNFFGGYRTGYGYGYRYSGFGGGFGPTISYVPYRKASVWFVRGRVDEWERSQ
ncbi:MAG: hypothetical protein NWT08_00370 [Akkermansiaceae bacterium]|jgi:hypothetical protein|nr:hypothetical protein [Akkermansiaceae bacterium]MDP4648171.1 hypothetical protein [Akkermansiaceae bacterium]MDP4721160.1 hypothetical protein [Akkermansiaceae bacterium]MDP4778900.1 hypothetical protein [Akkermansiaceae bacterium]MDP4846898.1 hypothetical protein [Akkermansiaceae bacterium]